MTPHCKDSCFTQSAKVGSEGHVFDTPLVGTTLLEHGLEPCAVHVRTPNKAVCGSPGSGKFATVGIHELLGLDSNTDLVCISEKPDLVNTTLGRFVDQLMFENPDWVKKFGPRLGVDPRGITEIKFWRQFGRAMNFDTGFQSAYSATPYGFLCDIDPEAPGAWARAQAVARGVFPEHLRSTGERYWVEAPREALSAVIGFVLCSYHDPRERNLIHCIRLLLGVDPRTAMASPKLQERLFKRMMRCPAMGGMIAKEGLALWDLLQSPRSFAPLMKTIGTKVGWLLANKELCDLLTAPPAFRLSEIGRGPHPLAVFVQPPRGDKSSQAILSIFLELLVMVLQQRAEPSKRRILIYLDELPQWSPENIDLVIRSLNILRDLNVSISLYFQSIGQIESLTSKATVAAMAGACAMQFLGCRDPETADWIVNKLGKTRIVRDGKVIEVDVADVSTVYAELAPDSPLQYFFPYDSGKAMKLYRPAMKDLKTREGLVVKGINWQGHFDEGLPPYSSRGKR